MSSIKDSQAQIARQLENAMNSLEGTPGVDSAMARLDQLRKSIHQLIESSRVQIDLLGEYSRRNVMLSGRLYAEVLASRMRPFSEGLLGFPRMVRELARSAGKKISIEIHGKDVPVDRDVLENLESPLTHIIRNACDHGIETPEIREALGKNIGGKIILKAWHSAGFLMLKISDDGKGLDEKKIRAKILENKLTTPEILERMTRDEVFEFLFLPGFTTKTEVTELSGRGVGLDVVQSMMREIGGSISITSESSKGASFTMRLPITRSVIKALIVSIGGQPYAFSLGRIYRTVKLTHADISFEDSRRKIKVDNKEVPLFFASDVLGLSSDVYRLSNEIYAVVASHKNNLYAFEVDDLPNESELVLRPLHESLGKIPCVSAASLDENGLPVLILDVDDLIAYADKISIRSSVGADTALETQNVEKKKILVVDDSATVRETQSKILETAGYSVDLAIDGMDGWNSARLTSYDLIVSDIDMPRMTGFELTAKIRKINKKIPIVIVSYKDRSSDRKQGLAAGASVYLTKSSFQDDTFIKTIRELIGK